MGGAEAALPIADGGARLVETETTPPADANLNARIYATRLTA